MITATKDIFLGLIDWRCRNIYLLLLTEGAEIGAELGLEQDLAELSVVSRVCLGGCLFIGFLCEKH